MSSSSSRYQSRLFNLIDRQSHRLTEKWDHKLRQLKVATVWGAQVVLYPVYLLFQATRLGGKQLRQAATKGWLQLQNLTDSSEQCQDSTLTSDAPIQQILRTIQITTSSTGLPNCHGMQAIAIDQAAAIAPRLTCQFTVVEDAPSRRFSGLANLLGRFQRAEDRQGASELSVNSLALSTLHRPSLQGIATLLASRTLVLIAAENQILDILTPEQQQKLQQRMIWEVANYWRRLRLVQQLPDQSEHPRDRHLFFPQLPAPVDRPTLLPPVRFFRQLMAWVQTSSIARAANLFQESTLVLNAPPNAQALNALPGWSIPGEAANLALTSVDQTIANWEADPVGSISQLTRVLRNQTQALFQWIQQQLGSTFPGAGLARQQSSPSQSKNSVTLTSSQVPTFLESSAFRVQNLIRSTIAYVSGSRSLQLLPASSPTPTSIDPAETLPEQAFSHLNAQEQALKPNQENPWLTWADLFGASDEEKLDNSSPRAIPESLKRNRAKARLTGQSRRSPSSPPQNLSVSATSASVQTGSQEPDKVFTHQSAEIEAEAVLIEYVKHPLQQILEWLDRGMAWLEGFIARIWHYGRSLGKRR
jgi:hypothetical protein